MAVASSLPAWPRLTSLDLYVAKVDRGIVLRLAETLRSCRSLTKLMLLVNEDWREDEEANMTLARAMDELDDCQFMWSITGPSPYYLENERRAFRHFFLSATSASSRQGGSFAANFARKDGDNSLLRRVKGFLVPKSRIFGGWSEGVPAGDLYVF